MITLSGMAAGATGDAQEGASKAASCKGCHGEEGRSQTPAYPSLAGMSEEYIVKQLKAFKEGKRENPVMANLATTLTEQDMHHLGAYYEQQSIDKGVSADEEAKQIARGRHLYFNGNARTGLAACVGCHGTDGRGLEDEPTIPPLRGQHSEYVYKMLKSFNEGMRSNDEEQMMRRIAERMSDKEMKALAAYVQYMARRQ